MYKLLASTLTCAVLGALATPAFAEKAVGTDVAYQALSEGRTAEAIAQLDKGTLESTDPAALINLGTAYARQGRVADARAAFTAAINSKDHYYLELADGRWVDSRKAAKMALAGLEKSNGIALR